MAGVVYGVGSLFRKVGIVVCGVEASLGRVMPLGWGTFEAFLKGKGRAPI